MKFYFCRLSRALVFHSEMQSQELRYLMILGSEIIALNTRQLLIILRDFKIKSHELNFIGSEGSESLFFN